MQLASQVYHIETAVNAIRFFLSFRISETKYHYICGTNERSVSLKLTNKSNKSYKEQKVREALWILRLKGCLNIKELIVIQ